MSLDLFANYERSSNSSLFYRTTASSAFSYKLLDLSNPDLDLPREYAAEYSLNGGQLSSFPIEDNAYEIDLDFDTLTPTVCSFYAQVTSLITEEVQSFVLSAVFIKEFPIVDTSFIVYPSLTMSLTGSTSLDQTNFEETNGVYFYGEGHTEKINLTINSTTFSPDAEICWYFGGDLKTFTEGQSALGSSTYVEISSNQDEYSVYPIHLLLKSPDMLYNPPSITYNDDTGEMEFYPFFDSTLDINGEENANNNSLHQSLSVLPYPTALSPVSLSSTFGDIPHYLPFDYSAQIFVTKLDLHSNGTQILKERFMGSSWNLHSMSEFGEWGGEEDALVTTNFLSGITAYQFQVGYQTNTYDALNYFNVYSTVDSTVTVSVTSYKTVLIDQEPRDWKPKIMTQTLENTLSCLPIPFTGVYTPNFYNLSSENIQIEILTENFPDLKLLKAEIDTNLETETTTISSDILSSTENGSLSGFIKINQTGVADVYATVFFEDTRLSSINKAPYIFPELFEVIPKYDDVEEQYYQTSLTPLTLSYTSQPIMSPNEWAIADNVNQLLVEFYTTIEELNQYTKLVTPKNKFIGVLTTDNGSLTSYNPWKFDRLDYDYFPLVDCNNSDCCPISDVIHIPNESKLLIAHPTILNIITDTRTPKTVYSRQQATDIYNFQNIIAIDITPFKRIVVLDDVLLTVSVFNLVNDTLNLIADWGGFGLASSPNQFNSPNDLHVDQEGNIYVADTGNNCVKKYTITGKNILTLISDKFNDNPPLSVCVDANKRIHCLTNTKVIVFDYFGNFVFEYVLLDEIKNVSKINTSYNRETVYISHETGVIRYFKTGIVAEHTINDYECFSLEILKGYGRLTQDKNRNLYIAVNNKLFKMADIIQNTETKAPINPSLYWNLNDILIHKEEYIQPWVYLKGFHRIWDNIELFRNSLFYTDVDCKNFVPPKYVKKDLIIGQNEIVTNSVINRLCEQLWSNIQPLIDYFDPNCKS